MTLNNRYTRAMITLALIALLMVSGALSSFAATSINLTVEGRSGGVGETLSVPIILSEAPNGISGFDLMVTLDDSSVASITDAQFPDFGIAQYDLISIQVVKARFPVVRRRKSKR